jgi:MFS family permease
MSTTQSRDVRFAALHNRNFTLLWAGLIVSNMGTWMQNVANGWLVLQLTNSPLWLGILGLSFAIPMIILPPLAGAVVDRVNRIRLLFFTQSMQIVIALTLATLTWFGRIEVWHILLATAFGAALLAFDNPARQALVPALVHPRDLLNAFSQFGNVHRRGIDRTRSGGYYAGTTRRGDIVLPEWHQFSRCYFRTGIHARSPHAQRWSTWDFR